MTIREIIDYVDEIKPNSYTDAIKLAWLNEIEGKVQSEIMMLALPECRKYFPDKSYELSGMRFTDDHTLELPSPIRAHVGGFITLTEMEPSGNEITGAKILNISDGGKTITFAAETFDEGEADGKLTFKGMDTEMIVPYPYERLYGTWLLVKISEHLEESNQDANATAKFLDDWNIFAAFWAEAYRPADGVPAFKGYYIRGHQGERGIQGPAGPHGDTGYISVQDIWLGDITISCPLSAQDEGGGNVVWR